MENNNSIISKIKENSIAVIFGIAGIVLVAVAIIYTIQKDQTPQEKYKDVTEKKLENCDVKTESYVVDGGTDIFPAGTEIEVELNYYACNKGVKDEIVMIKTPGREQPLIKYIKMVPGDKYEVIQDRDKKYKIEVNGDELENSKGEEYALSERKMRMIKLYETNFKDGIKDDVYFVFGDSTSGGFDSTRFGPVMPERMIGRVITKPENAKMADKAAIEKSKKAAIEDKEEVDEKKNVKEEVKAVVQKEPLVKASPVTAPAATKPAAKVAPKTAAPKPATTPKAPVKPAAKPVAKPGVQTKQ